MSDENGGALEDFPPEEEVDEDTQLAGEEIGEDEHTETSLANADDLLNDTTEQDDATDEAVSNLLHFYFILSMVIFYYFIME